MIEVRKLIKQYGPRRILNSLSFIIAPGDKISLVAQNGVGKTTLLNILAGEEKPTMGKVVKTGKLRRVSYFKQELEIYQEDTRTILAFVSPDDDIEKHKIGKMLALFSVNKPLETRMTHLSGGQQTKVALVKFLLSPGQLLILDEPTNNLDFRTIALLEKWIRQSKKTFIITSHDRKFLATLCTRVIEIGRKDGKITDRRGSYINYLKDRVNEKKDLRYKYKKYLEEVKRLMDSARRIRENSTDSRASKEYKAVPFLKRKSKQNKSIRSAEVLEHRSENLKKVEKPIDYEPPKFDWIHPEAIAPNDIDKYSISLKGAEIRRVEKEPLLQDINLSIKYPTRICILGLNGVGKTTLIDSIVSNKVLSGTLNVGESVVFSSIVQHSYAMESGGSVLEYFADKHNIDEAQAKEILENTDLGTDILKPLSVISSGQKMRIFLAGMGMAKANTLILDEPTNHLDIETLEALEYVLNFFPGNIILVTHDRLFLEKVENFVFYKIEDMIMKKIEDLPTYISLREDITKTTLSQFIARIERMRE